MATFPTDQELLGYFETLSNWQRWGPDDTLGTLNHITDEKRRAAAAEIALGRSVSCARTIATGSQLDDIPPQRYMIAVGEGVGDRAAGSAGPRHAGFTEYLGLVYHGGRITHLDALAHMSWDGRIYNGASAGVVTSRGGATQHDIVDARQGIFTRAVLLDIARFRGVPWLEAGEAVTRDEIEQYLAATDTVIGPGDGLLLRTGYTSLVAERGPVDHRVVGRAGWHASCLPLFYENDIAFIASDTPQDVQPAVSETVPSPIHIIAIVAMGLWLVDNCDFEELGRQCAELGRQSFAMTLAPLPFVGATGSPVNPLALF